MHWFTDLTVLFFPVIGGMFGIAILFILYKVVDGIKNTWKRSKISR